MSSLLFIKREIFSGISTKQGRVVCCPFCVWGVESVDCLSSDMKINKRNPYHNFLLNTPEVNIQPGTSQPSLDQLLFDLWSQPGPGGSDLGPLNWSSVLAGIRGLNTGRGHHQLSHEESNEETRQTWWDSLQVWNAKLTYKFITFLRLF